MLHRHNLYDRTARVLVGCVFALALCLACTNWGTAYAASTHISKTQLATNPTNNMQSKPITIPTAFSLQSSQKLIMLRYLIMISRSMVYPFALSFNPNLSGQLMSGMAQYRSCTVTLTNRVNASLTDYHSATHNSPLSSGTIYSVTWSGYMQRGSNWIQVDAHWTVPTVVCQTNLNATDSTWAGIGGDGRS